MQYSPDASYVWRTVNQMRRLLVPLASAIAFVVGLLVAPALATSYPGSPVVIFGNSTNCAFARASVNDETHKAGSQTKNVAGCSSFNNAATTVPTNSLGTRSYLYSTSGYLCGQSSLKFNTSPTSSITNTAAWISSVTCRGNARYYGRAEGQRRKAAGGWAVANAFSPSKLWLFDS